MAKDKEKEAEVGAEAEAEKVEKVVSEADELPKAIVRRVVKEKLSDCSADGDLSVQKDALIAFSESARIFIHYLSATANDICKESKRQTMNADDVLKALEEIEFPEMIGPLKASLTEFRRKISVKKAGASESKDRKISVKKAGASESKDRKISVKKAGASETKDVKKRKVEQETAKKSGGKSKQKKKD